MPNMGLELGTPENKSHMLYFLSQPGAPEICILNKSQRGPHHYANRSHTPFLSYPPITSKESIIRPIIQMRKPKSRRLSHCADVLQQSSKPGLLIPLPPMFFHLFSSLREGRCDWQLKRWGHQTLPRGGGAALRLGLELARPWQGRGEGHCRRPFRERL